MNKQTLTMLTLLIAGILILISGVSIPIVTILVCGMTGDGPVFVTVLVCGLIMLLSLVTLGMVNADD